MHRIRLGLHLANTSWHVLRSEKSLAAFPLLAAFFGLLYAVLVVAPIGLGGWLLFGENEILGIVLLFILLLGLSIATTFFGVAAAANASAVFDGRDPRLGDGLALARSRFGVIVQWALLSATVGVLIQIIADRLGGAGGAIVQAIGGLAWSVASFFALPILALEGLGPVGVLKRSTSVIKARWGESLVGTIGINLVTGLIAMGGILVGALGVWAIVAGQWPIGVALAVAGAVIFIIAATVGSILRAIFTVAVYRYATEGQALGGFTEDDLSHAFRAKRGRTSAA
jgi:hypothetical protein